MNRNHKFKKLGFLIYFSILAQSVSFSQLTEPGLPWGFDHEISSLVKYVQIPSPSINQISENQINNNRVLKPYTFAKSVDTSINILHSSTGFKQLDGSRVYLLGISSKGAENLNVIFHSYYLPPGGRVFLYTPFKEKYLGAFTEKNNKASGMLATMPLPGDSLIIEYQPPDKPKYPAMLSIGKIGMGFRDIFHEKQLKDSYFGSSGYCEVDINCAPGDEWQMVKHAVVRLLVNGSEICTGTLLNNTAQDGKPYVLTANHCISSAAQAQSLITIFNYESPYCSGPDGHIMHSISGASLKATADNLDFSLVELDETPPPPFKPYYAGWDRRTRRPVNTVCIHHPKGDVKKITLDNDTAAIGTYSLDYLTNSHWQILNWELGTTETGSSGSGLFNQDKRLVGDLTGGEASCSNNVDDFFTRFDVSWAKFPELNRQLKHWLDPENTGTDTLDGYLPSMDKDSLDLQLFLLSGKNPSYCGKAKANPRLIVKNNGLQPVTSYNFYNVWNGDTLSRTINAPLMPGELDTLQAGERELSTGDHAIRLFVAKPNGQLDDYPADDTVAIFPKVLNGVPVQFTLQTDEYGSETTWELLDSEGTRAAFGGPYADGQQNQLSQEICLDDSLYTFTIYDKMGDGICCEFGNGNYELLYQSTGKTIFQRGIFGDSAKHSFQLADYLPRAGFTAGKLSAIVHEPVQFMDTSHFAHSWDWHFEGGIPAFSNQQHPRVIFPGKGTFDISLSINDSVSYLEKEKYIAIIDSPAVANFSMSDTLVCMNDTVIFKNTSQGDTSIAWQFENGSPAFSNKESEKVVYTDAGKYLAKLTVNQATDSLVQTIHVGAPPLLSLEAQPESAPAANDGQIIANPSQGTPPYRVHWSTGATGLVLDSLLAGTYAASLVDEAGCIVSGTATVSSHNSLNNIKFIHDGISLSPNPANHFLDVRSKDGTIYNIQVYSSTGKLEIEKSLRGPSVSLNVSSLPPGIYHLHVSFQAKRISRVFAIIR